MNPERNLKAPISERKRIIVLGSGFAAVSFLKRINHSHFDVTVVSPRNHFLFTPLLPSTTVGTIQFRSIIEPIRAICSEARYYHASCIGVDPRRRTVECEGVLDGVRFSLAYDMLVIAVGAESNTFDVPGVHEHALLLKELADARGIRQRIIECLELADQPHRSDEERKQLLHFVIVGGGPTGVELAAEMHDFVDADLRKSYRLLVQDLRITILEATDKILSTFDAALAAYALILFRRQGIQVRTRSVVSHVRPDGVILSDGTHVPAGLVVWSTGIGPRPLIRDIPFTKDHRGRIVTDEFLRVQSSDVVYALGDCSVIVGKDTPATAQLAQQQGKYLSRALNQQIAGSRVKSFRYDTYGMLAYVGSGRALADLSQLKWRGFLAWLFWRSVYITRLVSIKNKFLVVLDWTKTAIFGRDTSRF